ncbi:MAG: hypothetical protein M1383_00575 [Patescibacteria group bacterium]|nr:hypothetical protein [Patescibacteria group bacterium]
MAAALVLSFPPSAGNFPLFPNRAAAPNCRKRRRASGKIRGKSKDSKNPSASGKRIFEGKYSASPILDNQMPGLKFNFQFLFFFPFELTYVFYRQGYRKTLAIGNFGKFADIMIFQFLCGHNFSS